MITDRKLNIILKYYSTVNLELEYHEYLDLMYGHLDTEHKKDQKDQNEFL